LLRLPARTGRSPKLGSESRLQAAERSLRLPRGEFHTAHLVPEVHRLKPGLPTVEGVVLETDDESSKPSFVRTQ
jgi:hypothetical protein